MLKPERMNRSKPANRPTRTSSPNGIQLLRLAHDQFTGDAAIVEVWPSSSMRNLSPEVSCRTVNPAADGPAVRYKFPIPPRMAQIGTDAVLFLAWQSAAG